jgi:hypothetical protein
MVIQPVITLGPIGGSAADGREFVCCSSLAFSNEATFAKSPFAKSSWLNVLGAELAVTGCHKPRSLRSGFAGGFKSWE